jgi:hypothetical protein
MGLHVQADFLGCGRWREFAMGLSLIESLVFQETRNHAILSTVDLVFPHEPPFS